MIFTQQAAYLSLEHRSKLFSKYKAVKTPCIMQIFMNGITLLIQCLYYICETIQDYIKPSIGNQEITLIPAFCHHFIFGSFLKVTIP